MNLSCPRCSSLLEQDLVAVTDGPNGIVGAVARHVPVQRHHCICGQFTWTRTSTIALIRQPALRLVGPAA